jgi:hypothetical protein
MATSITNRHNGVAGAQASQLSRHVSRVVKQLTGVPVNGRDALLYGVVVRQVGETVSVSVGFEPGTADGYEHSERHARERAAELATQLRERGYTVAVRESSRHVVQVMAHPGWPK